MTVAGLNSVEGDFQDRVWLNFEVTPVLANGLPSKMRGELRDFSIGKASVRFADGFQFTGFFITNSKGIVAQDFAPLAVAIFSPHHDAIECGKGLL